MLSKEKLNTIAELKAAEKTARMEEYNARNEARKAKYKAHELKAEVVADLFDNFLEEIMQEPESYIFGNRSSLFTKHVSRNKIYFSEEHRRAQRDFNDAQTELNRAFVNAILANPEQAKRKLMACSTLKNLD